MSFSLHPRAPHLSEASLRQALADLAAKIQTLRNRAHATAAGSANTYGPHADALEAKRAGLDEQLGQAPARPDAPEPSAWAHIRRGTEDLDGDLRAQF